MAAPLPLAPDRAVLSNRIALLLSNRASLLKTLNPPSSSPTPSRPAQHTRSRDHAADDEDFKFVQPNQGVGYVPDAKDSTAAGRGLSREQRLLLGKRRGGAAASAARMRAAKEAEEEDEDEGRSGLGRSKKRKRREADADADGGRAVGTEEEEEAEEEVEEAQSALATTAGTGERKSEELSGEGATTFEADEGQGAREVDDVPRTKDGKKKKKKKRKNEGKKEA